MGALLLKFFIMATIFGGILKAYIDVPFIHQNPKTAAGILIILISIGIAIFPKILGFVLKFIAFCVIVGAIGFFLFKLFGFGFDKLKKGEADQEAAQTQQVMLSKEEVQAQKQIQQAAQLTGQKDALSGVVTEVLRGYLFKLNNTYIKLYGIDTPDPNQNCKDKYNRDYPCGQMAQNTLEQMIQGKVLTCTPVGMDDRGAYIATCRTEETDVGAAMVFAGWAVADREDSQVYIPYEKQANQAKRGLWEGKFVAPWNWRITQQNAAASQATSKKKGFLGLF